MSRIKNIAIIGAGISGLACASALKAGGHSVTLYEKSKGVSGRLSTRVTDDWQCDHGAQYFTASHELFAAEIKRWQQAGVAGEWHPRLQVYEKGVFTIKRSQKARYVGIPRNTAPAKFLGENLNVISATTITNLKRVANGWLLQSVEKGDLPLIYDAVILAIPAPQAVALLNEALPELANIAQSVITRPCWALMCQFQQSLKLPFDGLFVNNELLSWVARDSSKPGRMNNKSSHLFETWILHANSQWSETHLEDSSETVAALMLEALVKLGGEVPQIYVAHRWRYADCIDYLQLGYIWNADMQIGICGDWLNGGKVEGAWLSGHLLANRLL